MEERTTQLREQTCATCGIVFTFRPSQARSGRRTYCSRPCVNYVRFGGKETRACPTCGASFKCYPSQPKKFCSLRCRRTPEGQNHVRPPASPRPCVLCAETYQPASPRQKYCKTCVPNKAARARARRYGSASHREQRYGVTAADWQAMRARYGGLCWICRVNRATCIDHCHATGRIRGALCRVCNMVLSYVERPGWWETARSYLKEVEQSLCPDSINS